MNDLYDMVQKMGDHIAVVTPDEFMQQIIKNVPHE